MSLKSMIRTRLSATLLAPALIAGATACTTNDPAAPSGIFFVLNANPEVDGLQMNLDEQGPIFSAPIAFGNYCCGGGFRVRESDVPRQVRFTSGTGTTVIAAADIQVHRDSIYFLVVARDGVDPTQSDLLIFKNNIAGPNEDEAKLRFMHTAPAFGAVDIYVTDKDADLNDVGVTPMFANLQYGQLVPHVVFTPPTDTLLVRITPAGNKATVYLDRKYTTRLIDMGGVNYLGVESFNTIFLVNDRNTGDGPLGVFQVGGI